MLGGLALTIPAGPFFPQSRVTVGVRNFGAPYTLAVIGAGAMHGDEYRAPGEIGDAAVIASAPHALALARIALTAPPPAKAPLIAVATYDDGIELFTPGAFHRLGAFAMGSPPGDAAFLPDGTLVAAQTDGDTLDEVARNPWNAVAIRGVPTVNELAVSADGTIYASDRDVDGRGALTRISRTGSARTIVTGMTAEGIAVDERRQRLYVGNVNSNDVAVVDMRTLRVIDRIPTPPRPFGIALDSTGRDLYVVSNQAPDMRGGSGYTAKIALGANPRIIARSALQTFPLGVVLDAAHDRLFVTDEAQNLVYVLSARTLRAVHAPLHTCRTPWRPSIANGRLYVPCAQADKVDVFALKTLQRAPNAPFATGGFPMHVATWP